MGNVTTVALMKSLKSHVLLLNTFSSKVSIWEYNNLHSNNKGQILLSRLNLTDHINYKICTEHNTKQKCRRQKQGFANHVASLY